MQSARGRTTIISVAATLVVLGLAGLAVMYSGAYNVAATAGHTSLVRWILQTTQERSIAARVDHVPQPPPVDSAAVLHGFGHFRSMCVLCHGAPGVERGELGKGITPEPPELSEAAEEFSERELFWITKHGIKMAGMPAFGPTHSDEEIWGIVAFLTRLGRMTPEEYAKWEARVATAGADSPVDSAAAQGHTHPSGTEAHGH